jgi:hypothetical protein
MGLLAASLERIDAMGMPTYLESTNPANNVRYARHGYRPATTFAVVDGGPVVTTMWRSCTGAPDGTPGP